jgi:next-to-BRCA1 protein 1
LKPDEDFTKTWKVSNIGTCNWMYQYGLVLLSGNAFSGKTTKLNRIVTVGHWAEVSVDMGAPHAFGAYTSYWRMTDADGHMFGSTLPISLVVGVDSTNTPEPPADTPVPTSTPTPSDTPTP